MKTKQLLLLVLAAGLLAGLAYHQAERENRRAAGVPVAGAHVFPDLDVNLVAALILRNDTATTTVQRVAGQWQVAEKHGYRVDFARLRDLLTSIAELKVGRPLRLNPSLRRELGLRPADSVDLVAPAGVQIELLGQDGHPLASLVLGQPFYRESDAREHPMHFHWRGADGRYVMTGANEAFLVSESFTALTTDPNRWIDRQFLDIPSHALVSIAWSGGDAGRLTLSRPQPGDVWQSPDLPADTPLDTDKIRAVTAALSNLRFVDIAPPSDSTEFPDNGKTRIEAGTADGRIYRLTFHEDIQHDGQRLHPLLVAVDYELPPDSRADDQDGFSAQELAETVHRHTQETRRINTQLANWVYLLDQSAAGTLLVKPEDLVHNGESAE